MRDNEIQELFNEYVEGAFGRVEFHAVLQGLESFLEVCHMMLHCRLFTCMLLMYTLMFRLI